MLSREDLTLHKASGLICVQDEKTRSERLIPLNASARSTPPT